MLNGPIPPHIDPRKLVDRGATLEGVYALADMPRVCEQLTSDAGEVCVKVSFERDHQKLAVMHMQLDTEVSMVCQRCLDAAAIPVHGEYTYAILREGQSADGLPKGYDALEVGRNPWTCWRWSRTSCCSPYPSFRPMTPKYVSTRLDSSSKTSRSRAKSRTSVLIRSAYWHS